jgi:aminoglycoside 2''-phosphotransferase
MTVRRARANDTGWGSFVLEVNGEWIFRFPRSARDRRITERALRFYPLLERVVPVPIPHHETVVRSRHGTLLFVGYRRLPGRGLPESSLRGPAATRWVEGLAGVLRALERVPIAVARSSGIPIDPQERSVRDWEERYAVMRREVWPLLDREERRRDASGWESTLAARGLFRYRRAVGHGDLYASHVLHGPGDTGISGILDWEDCRVGDPAGNLAVLPTSSGFVRRVFEHWRRGDNALWTRAGLRRHYAFGTNLVHWRRQRRPEKVAEWRRRYLSTVPELTLD